MPDTQRSPYMGLDKALLRSTRKDVPADHEPSKPANWQTGKLADQEASEQATEPAREKMTYRLRIEALDGIEEIKRHLKRSHNIRATNERIVEEAILHLYEDFLQNKETSLLVSRFTSKQGGK